MQHISPARDSYPFSSGPRRSYPSPVGSSSAPWQQPLQHQHQKPVLSPETAPAPTSAYPSPPMSGTPPPPATSQEASERMVPVTASSASSYSLDSSAAAITAAAPLSASAPPLYPVPSGSRTEDLYRTTATSSMMHAPQPDDLRAHQHMPVMPLHPPPMAAYQPMPQQHPAPDFDRMGFYHRPDAYSHFMPHATAMIPSHPYPPQPQQIVQSMGQPMGQTAMYGNPARPATIPGSADMGAYGSPKPSRKAKGHVASACVPSHRPCTRCLMNGKEDCCIDVQHKKRGRPRLRDEREARFDPRIQSASSSNDTGNIRRPPGPGSSYSSAASTAGASTASASGYDQMIHRTNLSFRVLKSQPREPLPPRFVQHASAADANIYSTAPPAASTSNSTHEPIAYLMLKDLEIAKASVAFAEAVGLTSMYGVRLHDILASYEREKIKTLNNEMRGEQERSQPNYLPPIFADHQVERVVQSLKFTAEDIARFNMDRRDRWDFQSPDGQIRTHNVRFGLAKQDSIYFVVLQIVLQSRFQFSASASAPSPHAATGYASYPAQHAQVPQVAYGQPLSTSGTFDPSRGYGDASLSARQAQQQGHPSQLLPGPSPGISPGLSTYAASPSRPDYPMGPASFHTPRTEMPNTSRQQQPLLPPQAQTQSQMPAQPQGQSQVPQAQQNHLAQASSGCHQLPPIRGQTPSQVPLAMTQSMPMMGSADSGWIKDDRTGRVNIEGLLERPSHLQRQPPSS
ncbi:hypothetical protein BROUX41_005901 [Berkeleyomyces rouxiae]